MSFRGSSGTYGRSWSSNSWSEQSSRPWNEQSSHSWTPDKKPRNYDEPWSPHGKPEHSLQLPKEFQTNSEYYDTTEVGGKALPRKVLMTQWTSKCSFAGRDISDIRLHEVCWQGWKNWHLRLLSAGQFLTVVFCRRVSEAVFVSQLLSAIRERRWDLDQVAA